MRPPDAPEPAQLVLDLPHLAATGAEDFLVSPSNRVAADAVESWPRWAHPWLVVVGPEGAGKSHLGSVWRHLSGASVVSARELTEGHLRALERERALAVEDIDRGLSDEQLLFHAMNLARERQGFLLLTSRVAPGEIPVTLPDLRSRLRAAPMAVIEPPDDALLKAVLVKLFADRQLAVEPHVIAHLALHIERSLSAASRVVAVADRLALARQRRVTRALAAEALTLVSAGDPG